MASHEWRSKMKLFRNKKNKKLYTIAHVRPPMILGSWYEAKPYKWEGETMKHCRIDLFEEVAEANIEKGIYGPTT